MQEFRIKATDKYKNLRYVYRTADGHIHCVLANGTSASFSYFGIAGDQMEFFFALKDCETAEEALAICELLGGGGMTYSIMPIKGAVSAHPLVSLDFLKEIADPIDLLCRISELSLGVDPVNAQRILSRLIIAAQDIRDREDPGWEDKE